MPREPPQGAMKVLISYGGSFKEQRQSTMAEGEKGKLRYVGGETRIISLDRGAPLPPCRSSRPLALPPPDLGDRSRPRRRPQACSPSDLGDEDVRSMVAEYDRFLMWGKVPRLRVFLCDTVPSLPLRFQNWTHRPSERAISLLGEPLRRRGAPSWRAPPPRTGAPSRGILPLPMASRRPPVSPVVPGGTVNLGSPATSTAIHHGFGPSESSSYMKMDGASLGATIKGADLEEIRELGSGTFGTVFHGKWRGSDVAVKRLKPSCFSGGGAARDRLTYFPFFNTFFIPDRRLLEGGAPAGSTPSSKRGGFYGVVTDGTSLATVTEYMVNGSLKQVLRKKDRTIDRRKRLIIAMDAAFGMEYLHEKGVVHFDLKSHNFLVNMRDPHRPVCKIGDLGLSKVKRRTLVSGGVRGTIPWMAPELLNSQTNMVTDKVDVYSFGVVMWELLTGEEPYGEMPSEQVIGGIIKGELRPEIPSWCEPMWRSLMERCWASDPSSRPAFSDIAKELRAMAAAMNIL
ncbi:unnamed protein product [Spirodela intermedia]|uniref:Protein kinase domain-containing protein n=1 Tax=Spirodela intermedia TaxID=51605 RepID=A0A7I8J8I7_SPIIN|nr:unnamed protein product [Spirodela intermedia]CAA6666370.1 unnamed protein product [Spirodela intermedia]